MCVGGEGVIFSLQGFVIVAQYSDVCINYLGGAAKLVIVDSKCLSGLGTQYGLSLIANALFI
jgi:hypothetical protein